MQQPISSALGGRVHSNSVVFCPVHKTSLEAMLPVANYIQCKEEYYPVFLIGSLSAGFRIVEIQPYEWNSKNKLFFRFRQAVSGQIHKWILSGYTIPNRLFLNTDEFYKRLTQYYSDVVSTLKDLEPVSVVIPDDRSLAYGFLPAVIKASGKLGIPRVIPPISYAADRKTLGKITQHRTQYISRKNKLYKRYPGNLLLHDKFDERAISFYTPEITEILYRFDALPDTPWVMGGGHADQVLVDGQDTASRYIKDGCDSRKIIVTGHPAHDDLFKVFKNRAVTRSRLNKKYGLEKPHLTILSLPQMGEEKTLPWAEHWQGIHFLSDTFSKGQGDTLISLHPKMDKKQYLFIETEYGLRIVDEPLREILPVADSFAATFSSTIEWAVLCRVPAIVFDFYNLNYDMFDEYKGVVVINDQRMLSSTLDHIQCDQEYLERLSNSHSEKASSLSPFDGECMTRVAEACCYTDK